MKVYSDVELHRILEVVNDSQYNAIRLTITTDALEPSETSVNQAQEKSDEDTNAELGGNP